MLWNTSSPLGKKLWHENLRQSITLIDFEQNVKNEYLLVNIGCQVKNSQMLNDIEVL